MKGDMEDESMIYSVEIRGTRMYHVKHGHRHATQIRYHMDMTQTHTR